MKKVTVITSQKAKEHLAKARAFMDEMKSSMAAHRSMIEGERMQSEQRQREDSQTATKNEHEKIMQKTKLGIDALI